MSEENTHRNQWDWLQNLEPGTKIVAENGIWIRLLQEPFDFANVDTGQVVHFAHLASLRVPPRIYCRPSPFDAN